MVSAKKEAEIGLRGCGVTRGGRGGHSEYGGESRTSTEVLFELSEMRVSHVGPRETPCKGQEHVHPEERLDFVEFLRPCGSDPVIFPL